MSEKLREIMAAYDAGLNDYYVDNDNKVMEHVKDDADTFTGFYQDKNGSYFTEEAWNKEKARLLQDFEAQQVADRKQIEKDRVEKLKEDRAAQMAASQKSDDKSNSNGVVKNVIAILVAAGIIAAGIILWPSSNEDIIVIDEEDIVEDQSKPFVEKPVFGNAIITGNDVNLRAEPSTQATIVTFFSKSGERVEVVKDSIVDDWKYIKREDATYGWVYSLYVNDSIDKMEH